MHTSSNWNEPLLKEPSQAGIFLQSYEWGELQEMSGARVHRFEFLDQHVQVFEYALPFGWKYWHVPRVRLHQKSLYALLDEARTQHIVYILAEPRAELAEYDFKKVPAKAVMPQQTSIIEIADDVTMLASMHQKTRYNIRLAQKKGVEIILDEEGTYFTDFLRLMKHTGNRNKFGIAPDHHYAAIIAQPSSFLLHAKYNDEIIASHLYWIFGDTVTYLHGASASVHREVMAPYLVYWQSLMQARARGCEYLDTWGIDEQKWESLTRFKRGFGGFEVVYPDVFTIPLSWKYYLITWLRRMKHSLLK